MSGLSPTKHPRLYAVITRPDAPPEPKRHRDNATLLRDKMAEFKAKKAIDRLHELRERLNQRIESLDEEIQRLQRRKQFAVERLERINDRTLEELEKASLTRADGFTHSVLSVPTAAAVEIDDVTLIPADYMRQPKLPAPAPDKVKIKKALEARQPVPGCHLAQGSSLRWT